MDKYIKKHINNKKSIIVLAMVVLTATIILLAANQVSYAGMEVLNLTGSGTEDDPYMLTCEADIINLQEFSKTDSCIGLYFKVSPELKDQKYYYVEDEEDEEGSEDAICYNARLTTVRIDDVSYTFQGIGSNVNYPFMGNIDFQGITILTDTNVFGFIGDGASIKTLNIMGTITNTKNNTLYGTQSSIGALAGVIINKNANSVIDINTIHVDNAVISSDTKSAGGLIGTIIGNGYNQSANNLTINLKDITVNASITGTGTLHENYYSKVSSSSILKGYPGYTGGLVGDVATYNNIAYVTLNITGATKVSGDLQSISSGVGGLIGYVGNKVTVNLKDNIDLSEIASIAGVQTYSYKGYAIGSISYAFIHQTGDLIIPQEIKDSGVADIDINKGGFLPGNIFRNLNLDSVEAKVLGDGTKESPYIIHNGNDLCMVALVLTTNGYFGTEYFSYPSDIVSVSNKTAFLRKAYYNITDDIDLASTGYLRINRTSTMSFSGCIEGIQKEDGTYPCITNNIDSNQNTVALIAYATPNGKESDIYYKNFSLFGSIKGKNNVSAFISQITEDANNYGTVTFENIESDVDLDITGSSGNSGMLLGLASVRGIGSITTGNKVHWINFNNITCSGDLNIVNNNYGSIMGNLTSSNSTIGYCVGININNFKLSGDFNVSGTGNNGWAGTIGVIDNQGYKSLNIGEANASIYSYRTPININNAEYSDINLNISPSNTANTCGGLIGNTFSQVKAEINNTQVNNCNVYTNNMLASFGFMINAVGGELDFNTLYYNNVTINRASTGSGYTSGILSSITNGIFNINDYKVENSVMNLANLYGADAVGNTIAYANSGSLHKLYSGIVTINGKNADGKWYSPSCPYVNQFKYNYCVNGEIITENSKIYGGGRLHYNALKDADEGFIKGTGTADDPFIIDSEEKLMIFYAFNTEYWTTMNAFIKYFDNIGEIFESGTDLTIIENQAVMLERIRSGYFVFANDLDMSEYSYYSATIYGGKYFGFNAHSYLESKGNINPTDEEIAAICKKAVNVLESGTDTAGLTYEECLNSKPIIRIDYKNVYSGSYNGNSSFYSTSLGSVHKDMQSGLFSGIYGSQVDINNLQIEGNYLTSTSAGAGSLITRNAYFSGIVGSTVNIKNIDIGSVYVTAKNPTYANNSEGKGLLIDTISDSKVNFNNIKILDGSVVNADALIGYQVGLNSKTVFRHMDLNAVLNNENPTLEKEGQATGLKYGMYFFYLYQGTSTYWYEEGVDVVTPGTIDGEGLRTVPNETLLNSKKYAYKIQTVDVNPVTANITKGNGTIEDPFIIENPGQLLTIALCLRSKGVDTDSETWYVGNATNEDFDNNDNTTWEGNYMERADAVDFIASASYKLSNDIDLSNVPKGFLQAASNFNGIGTNENPFTGSLDGNGHSFTFGNDSDITNYQFGLFRYVQGAKVSNLTILPAYKLVTNEETGETTKEYQNINTYNASSINATNSSVGMVAAVIKGGDNIIDNVTVKTVVTLPNGGGADCYANIGGYVGTITGGTLTICNSSKDNLKEFSIINKNGVKVTLGNGQAPNTGGIVGMVANGYVIYDDGSADFNPNQLSSDIMVIESGGTNCEIDEINYYNENGIRASNRANIINKNYLESIDKMVVSGSTDTGFTCEINDEKQLYLFSIALNSGALSAYGSAASSNNNNFAYNSSATTWKNAESWTSTPLTNSKEEIEYNYPAVFEYFDFTNVSNGYLGTLVNGDSVLNIVNGTMAGNKKHRTTYILKENSTYDMTTEPMVNEFKGISNRFDNYSMSTYFNNSFDGNGSTIKINITSDGNGGFFNLLSGNTQSTSVPYEIGNFTVEGKVNGVSSCGGVIGYIKNGVYNIHDINCIDMEVTTSGYGTYAGGIIGYVGNVSVTFENLVVGAEDCEDASSVIIKGRAGAGGVAGYIGQAFTIENVNLSHTSVIAPIEYSAGAVGNIGGIVGYAGNTGGNIERINNAQIYDCLLSTKGKNIGGVIGYVAAPGNTGVSTCYMHNINIYDNTYDMQGTGKTAKIIGTYQGLRETGVLNINDANSQDFSGNTPENYINLLTSTTDNNFIYYNDFKNIEDAEEKYNIDRNAVDENGRNVVRYTELLESIFTKTEIIEGQPTAVPVDLIPDTPYNDTTIIKWSSDSGTIETVLNSILNTLTNGTGCLNNGVNDNISISVQPMQVCNGVVSVNEGQTPSVSIESKAGTFVVSNNNIYDSIERKNEDGTSKPGTFSLINVTYKLGIYTETIQIPFFVSKMINVDVYSRITIGEEYNQEIMKNISDSLISVTKDSSYTVYTEYMYSNNRADFETSVYMNKGFKFDNSASTIIPVGTLLTLVDVTDDIPKTYYYKVDRDFIDLLLLTEFTDINGNHYKERDITDINQLKVNEICETMYVNGRKINKYNRGLEKYFLFVDCSNVPQSDELLESQITPIIDDVEALNSNEVFYVRRRCATGLSTFNGRNIGFVDNSISSSGQINKSDNLKVSAQFYNKATDVYWNQIYQNDYNNAGKYLEVAIYLQNQEGDKILMPAGTRVKLGESDSYETIKNTSTIYYYKDGVKPDGYSVMSITGNKVDDVNISFDFTYAKMENLPAGKYKVVLELVKTNNSQFPMGEDTLDKIETDYIDVTTSAEYGFSITADTQDLAINMYGDNNDHEIELKMNFSSTLSAELAADKNIEIQYQLFKKDILTGAYKPYESTENIYPKLLFDSETVVLNNEMKTFNKIGIAGENQAAVSENMVLYLPKELDTTNYKLEATMYVNGVKIATDKIIFNISNISIN